MNPTALLKAKPVTLLAVAHAVMLVAVTFGVVEWDGRELAAVEGVFAALGFKAAGMVTANVRLDADTLAAARERPSSWAGSLTDDDAAAIGDALGEALDAEGDLPDAE